MARRLRSDAHYTYEENSCYADTLLMAIMFNESSSLREEILGVNVDELEWDDIDLFSCLGGVEEVRKYARDIQTALLEDYSLILSGRTTKCFNFRFQLARCLPGLREDDEWALYNIGAFYNMLTQIFPNLKLRVPRVFTGQNGDIHILDKYEAMISITEYILAPNVEIGDIESGAILWDAYSFPYLIISNDSVIKKIGEVGREVSYYYVGDERRLLETEKHRKLDEHILNGRYELISVALLKGVKSGREGGEHYVGFFKNEDGMWSYFDDLRGVYSSPSLPRYVFEEKGDTKPNLFIYRRV